MKTSTSSPTADALALVDTAKCRGAFLAIGLFSAVINVLALTSSLYMLQVYDRVLPSRSVPTLVGLTVLMLVLYAGYGALDAIRTRVTSRVGLRLDRELREMVLGAVVEFRHLDHLFLLCRLRFRGRPAIGAEQRAGEDDVDGCAVVTSRGRIGRRGRPPSG